MSTIRQFLDEYLQRNGRKSIGAVEANALLDKAGILKDNPQRPGLPLRNKLRKGELPHAYQIAGKGSEWVIPLSTTKPKNTVHIDEILMKHQELSKKKKDRDEDYVIDLCDEVLGEKASRQHRFEFLTGDAGTQLPVDAYYASKHLVVEYNERQHTEAIDFFDKKKTVSGVSRGEQRKIYDKRRKEVLPQHNITLVIISYDDFTYDNKKRILRNKRQDLETVKNKLIKAGILIE